jgi:hypothetical protein
MGTAATRSMERVAAALGELENAQASFEIADDIPEVKTLRAKVAILGDDTGRTARWSGEPARDWMAHDVQAAVLPFTGVLTLIATAPNLVVNSELMRQGAAGFHFFSVTRSGWWCWLPITDTSPIYHKRSGCRKRSFRRKESSG